MHPLFPQPLVDCISTARSPTSGELAIVTDRIWNEGLAPCSRSDRSQARLLAQAALCGDDQSSNQE